MLSVQYAECRFRLIAIQSYMLSVDVLNVITLSVVVLNVIMPRVVILNVIMLSVVF